MLHYWEGHALYMHMLTQPNWLALALYCALHECPDTVLHRAAKLPHTYLLRAAEDQHRVVVVQGSLGQPSARFRVLGLPVLGAVNLVHNLAINVQQLVADQQPFVKSNGPVASSQ